MAELKEVIELLENFRARGRYAGNIEKVDQVLALLKEQPPAGDFTKKVREDWDKNIFGGVIFDLCDRLDRQVTQLKAKDELLFAYESVRAPNQPVELKSEVKLWKLRVDEAADVVESQQTKIEQLEASRKELVVACKIGLDSMRGLCDIADKLKASNKDKRKHNEHIKFVEAAIIKAQGE